MRLLVALLPLLCFSPVAEAVTYAYTSTAYTYDTPSGTATTVGWHASGNSPACTNFPLGDDDFADIVFPSGFQFTYGGTAYSGVRVYSNGILAFGTDTSGFWKEYTPQALPITAASSKAAPAGCASTVPVNLMQAYWIDIVAGTASGITGASVQYELLGTAPSRRFVISWVNVALYGNSATRYSFQIVLKESLSGANGNFEYRYTPGSASNGLNATVGVQLSTSDYTQYAFNQQFIDTVNGTAVLWYPANQLAAKGAEYRFDESSWTGTAGEIKDTSGSGQNASRTSANVANVAAGKLCRGATFTNNTSNAIIDAVATPITPANIGSVDFWYKSNVAWNAAGSDAMLIDASPAAAKAFYLMKLASGALKFVLTDSAGVTYVAQTSTAYTTAANTWVHVGISWNVKIGTNQTVQQIMINGALQTTNTSTPFRSTTSGSVASFSTIYIGDNRTSGVTPTGGTPNGANGTIDEVYIYASEINATQEGADAALTRSTCTSLDHFHIVHAGTVVNCGGTGANVTVEAHDINHALFTLAGTTMQMATSTGNGTWSSVSTINPVNSTGGGTGNYTFANENTIILGLLDPNFETLNINLAVGAVTERSGAAASCVSQDYTVGTTCDANLTFTQSGFIFATAANGTTPIPSPQIAGTTSVTYYLRAVQAASTSSSACTTALTGASTVNLAYECNDPSVCSGANLMTITGSAATVIQRNNNGASLSYTSVPLVFDASGNAPFTMNFADVGRTTLYASKTIAPTTLTGTSGIGNTPLQGIITRPFGFTLSNIKTTATSFANPAAANASGTAFIKAGAAFTATVTANNASGGATPNFGLEASPTTVTLTAALVGGLGLSNIPALNNASAFGTFSGGSGTGTTFSWDEVGIITLTPSTSNYLNLNTYLGGTQGNVTGTTSGNVGRFTPGQFTITPTSVTHACVPAAPAGVNPFTYFSQDGFKTTFVLMAKNVAGTVTTQNYAGSFAKFGLNTWSNYAFGTLAALPAGSALSASATAPAGSWGTVGGSSSPGGATVAAMHQVSRPTALTGPTSVTITALPVDSDGVTLSPATAVAVGGAVSPLYLGRLRIPNSAGSQYRNLNLPLTVQYYNGSGYTTNTDDGCSQIPIGALNFGNFRKSMISTDAVSLAPTAATPLKFSQGAATMILQKPVSPHTGTYDLAIALNTVSDTSCLQPWAPVPPTTVPVTTATTANLPYLQSNWCGAAYTKDPSARITFGVYRGASNFVYQRENF